MILKTNQHQHTNLHVITGGPGVGKTTLIQALGHFGFNTVAEDARKIIQQQNTTGGSALPWKDKTFYASLMLQASFETYQKAITNHPEQPMFFDRGIVDTLCYMIMEKIRKQSAIPLFFPRGVVQRLLIQFPAVWKKV
jgi:predicted ATPase